MNSVAHKCFSLPRAILDWPTLLNEEIVFISFYLDDATECWEEFLQQSSPSHFSFPHHLELDFETQPSLFTQTSAVYSKHNCWSKVNITQQNVTHTKKRYLKKGISFLFSIFILNLKLYYFLSLSFLFGFFLCLHSFISTFIMFFFYLGHFLSLLLL